MRMFLEIETPERAARVCRRGAGVTAQAAGFGHLGYRAVIHARTQLRTMAEKLGVASGDDRWFRIGTRQSNVMREAKGIDIANFGLIFAAPVVPAPAPPEYIARCMRFRFSPWPHSYVALPPSNTEPAVVATGHTELLSHSCATAWRVDHRHDTTQCPNPASCAVTPALVDKRGSALRRLDFRNMRITSSIAPPCNGPLIAPIPATTRSRNRLRADHHTTGKRRGVGLVLGVENQHGIKRARRRVIGPLACEHVAIVRAWLKDGFRRNRLLAALQAGLCANGRHLRREIFGFAQVDSGLMSSPPDPSPRASTPPCVPRMGCPEWDSAQHVNNLLGDSPRPARSALKGAQLIGRRKTVIPDQEGHLLERQGLPQYHGYHSRERKLGDHPSM